MRRRLSQRRYRQAPERRVRPGVEALENRLAPALSGASPLSLLDAANPHVDPSLLNLVAPSSSPGTVTQAAADPASSPPPAGVSRDLLQFDAAGRVAVEVTARDVPHLLPSLQALGFQVAAALPAYHLIDGYLPTASLLAAGDLSSEGLLGVLPAYRPMTSAGRVTSEGDAGLEANRVRAVPGGPDGTGVKIGVISGSYDNLAQTPGLDTAANDIQSGDLPAAGVTVLQEQPSGGDDEGRAMLQIVHDLAPGATLGFSSDGPFAAAMAQSIRNLADPTQFGANVIVDDVIFHDEPYFQDGLITQAVDDVVTNHGVAYFSSAGNYSNQAYEATNVNFTSDTITGISPSPQSYYAFDGAAADRQWVTINDGATINLGLQWDQPFYTASGVATRLNFYLLNHNTGQLVKSATDDNIATQTPLQTLAFTNSVASTGTTQFDLVIEKAAGPAVGRLKYVNFAANGGPTMTWNTFATHSPTLSPHAASVNAMAVAAAPFFDQRNPESFTALGPSTILFDAQGNRLTTPQVRAKPDITAIDGVHTSFFTGMAAAPQNTDYSGFPSFFGTSAAAPHAAAVAALVKQANPGFTPAQIYNQLKTTADPNVGGTPGNANLVGAGLIDAYRAVFGQSVAANPNVSDGFESGYLGQDWEVYNSGAGRTLVTSVNGPASGTYHLTMDGFGDGKGHGPSSMPSALSEAILHLNATGVSSLMLSFKEKEFNDPDDPMPATFAGHGNYDGVALSVDGVNWYRIDSLTGSASTSVYQANVFNLAQLAAADGLTLSADTRIKFQHYNSQSLAIPDQGFAFDDVQVAAGPPVTNVTSTTADGTYTAGATIAISVTFGAPVTVSGGTPQLALNSGGKATYISGSSTSTLVFQHVVAAGESSAHLDYAGTAALTFNGATIRDAAGNSAFLALPPDGSGHSLGDNTNLVITTPYALYTVTNTGDSGTGSLRWAVGLANAWTGPALIAFSPSVFATPQTIGLTSGPLSLTNSAGTTVVGPGAALLTVSGNNVGRVFSVPAGATATLLNLTVSNGKVQYDGANFYTGVGGGILNDGTLTVSGCTLSGNSASTEGGGIYSNGALTVTGSSFSFDTATYGGGLENFGTGTVTGCTLTGNSATTNGGGMDISGGALTVTGCTLSANTAPYGAGLANFGTLAVTSSTLSGNTAGTSGGGLYTNTALTVTDSTVSGNSAAYGGGIYIYAVTNGTLTLTSSIVAANTVPNAANGPDVNGAAQAASAYDLIGDGTGMSGISQGSNNNQVGTTASPLSPKLAALGWYGGPTQTMPPLPGSPALAAGNPAAKDSAGNTITLDQRGLARAVAGKADVGAFQTQADPFLVNTPSDAPGPGLLTLRGAVNLADALNTASTIHFDATAFQAAQTIALTGGPLALTDSAGTTVQGPGAALLTVSGNNAGRVFSVPAGITATISGLTISNGNAQYDGITLATGYGGGIRNDGTLTVTNCTLSGNSASGSSAEGGGIYSSGTLTVTNCTLSGDSVSGTSASGGGIYSSGTLTLTGSTLSGDTATHNGGGLFADGPGTATVTGSTLSSDLAAFGGGICNGGTLTVTGSTLSGSRAGTSGGGLYTNTALTVTGSALDGNSAQFGGGLYTNTTVTVTVTNSTLDGNAATDSGGGAYNNSGTLALTGCTVNANTATAKGGGICNFATVTVAASTLSEDAVLGSPNQLGYGGAVYSNGTLTLTGSVLGHDFASDAGGGLYADTAGTATVTGCALVDDLTGFSGGDGGTANGGGIANYGALTVTSSTLSGDKTNSADNSAGGGLYTNTTAFVTVTLTDCTLSGNSATFGGGIYTDRALTLTSSIVAANTARDAGSSGPDVDGSLQAASAYDLIGNGGGMSGISNGSNNNQVGTSASPLDPKLVAVGWYGGPTPTMPLLPGSPALNAGNPNPKDSGGSTITLDQRGFARAVGGQADVGAFQTQTDPFLVNTTSDALGPAAGLLTLRSAIALADALPTADIIHFDPAVFQTAQTITLVNGPLELTDGAATTVLGPGAGLLTVSGNNASRVFSVPAGAVATLSGLTISNGKAQYNGTDMTTAYGGGIRNNGTLTLSNCTLSGNSAGNSGGGGAIYSNGTLTVTNCTLSGNSASNGGGIFNDTPGAATVAGSTLNNDSAVFGGGLENLGTLGVISSTLIGDTAGNSGGALYNSGGATATLTCDTVSGNSGSAIQNWGTLTLTSSIVAANTGSGTPDVNGAVQAASSYDLIGDGTGTSGISQGSNNNQVGTTASPISPKLAPLGWYGGPTQTLPPLPGSPALAAGNPGAKDSGGSTITLDQRGLARAVGGQADVGAFQTQADPFLVNTTSDVLGPTAGLLTLRNAVSLADVLPSADTIHFDATAFGAAQTITLANGPLALTDAAGTTVQGPGAALLTVSGNNAGRVFSVPAGAVATLSGLTVSNGKAQYDGHTHTTGVGGGILNDGTLTVTNCTLRSNSTPGSSGDGGAIYSNGTLTVTGSALSSNSAGDVGGGIFCDTGGILTLTSSTFSGNSAAFGGGLCNFGTLTVAGSTLSTNTAGTSGGGVYTNTALTVTGSTFSGNSAANGGGVFTNTTLTVTVTGSTFSGNTATNTGGAMTNSSGSLTVTGCTLSGNSAPYGAGLANFGTLAVTSSTLAGNTAGTSGGGLYTNTALTVTDSTLSGNSATYGGGIFANAGAALTLTSSIVAANTVANAANGPDVYGAAQAASSYNLVGNGSALSGISQGSNGNQVGTTANPINPLLAPLGSYGGPTQTLALLPGSPALGAGNPDAKDPGGNTITIDQRGVARTISGRTDAGAFESQGFTIAVVSGGGQGATVGTAFANALVAQVTPAASGEPVQGGQVTFAGPGSGAGITPASAVLTLNAGGQVSLTVTANTTAGAYSVSAGAAGAGAPAAFGLTNTPGAADHLAFAVQPSNTLTGVAISPAVQVQVLDHYGNLLTGDSSDQVTLAVKSGPGGFTSGSTTLATVSGGVATFSNLVFSTRGNYTLGESATGGLTGPDSTSFAVSWPPIALVGSPQVNGDLAGLAGAQRSMVKDLVYTFNHAVTLAAGAFTIALHANVTVNGKTGQTVGVLPALSYSSPDGGVTWVVTFSGSGVVNGSVADGVYDLTLNAASVSDAQGQALSANRVDTFYRLFGDADGNHKVNNADLAAFSAAFNKRSNQAGYLAYLDYDGSGRIDNGDLAQFANRFNTAFAF